MITRSPARYERSDLEPPQGQDPVPGVGATASDFTGGIAGGDLEPSPHRDEPSLPTDEPPRQAHISWRDRPHVDGWKGIAAALEMSQRWCRDMANRSHCPLPVVTVGGIVRLYEHDFYAWIAVAAVPYASKPARSKR